MGKSDRGLLFATGFLVLVGMMMMFSTSSVAGLSEYSDSYFYVKRHAVYLMIGAIALWAGWRIPYSKYRSVAMPGFIGMVILLAVTLIPGVGVKIGGASRWIDLGIIQLQPIEVGKVMIAIFLATAITNKRGKMASFKDGMVPVLAMILIPVGILLKQPDLGNSILILGTVFIVLFLSHTRVQYLIGLVMAGITAISISIWRHPYQLNRIKTFLDPWKDPMGQSYHIIQSFIAIGSGGFFGKGLGQGKLKYFYLPLHHSDFIFAVVCEEGGFLGGVSVIAAFLFILTRGLAVSRKSADPFGYYLGTALTLFIGLQALMNIGVVIGVLPITGIPLTFISYGGTSLIMSLFAVGILLNISKGTSS